MWICDGNNTQQLCIKPYGFLVDLCVKIWVKEKFVFPNRSVTFNCKDILSVEPIHSKLLFQKFLSIIQHWVSNLLQIRSSRETLITELLSMSSYQWINEHYQWALISELTSLEHYEWTLISELASLEHYQWTLISELPYYHWASDLVLCQVSLPHWSRNLVRRKIL